MYRDANIMNDPKRIYKMTLAECEALQAEWQAQYDAAMSEYAQRKAQRDADIAELAAHMQRVGASGRISWPPLQPPERLPQSYVSSEVYIEGARIYTAHPGKSLPEIWKHINLMVGLKRAEQERQQRLLVASIEYCIKNGIASEGLSPVQIINLADAHASDEWACANDCLPWDVDGDLLEGYYAAD